MRNLKRALSLTLASVMLLGMMVVGTSAAAGYDDVKDTDNVEAIEVLQAVEVMVGDDRGFGPDRPVTRNEMAVVMGKLLNLNYNYYASTCPFTDVAAWARGWVGACYANGIVSGRGQGIYDGEATVTAVEAASMMMRALGYFKHTEDYADGFQLSTVRQGSDIGIFNGIGTDATTPMTRNQVAQMALNALKSEMVTFTGTPGIEVNGVTVGYRAEYTPRTSTEVKYQAIERRTNDVIGGNNLNRGQYYIQLGEELYNGDLRLNNEDQDVFLRPARTWEYKGKEIGTYVKTELLKESYSTEVTGKALYDLLTKNTIDTYHFEIAIDGVSIYDTNARTILGDAYFNQGNMVRTNTRGVGATGKGVTTEVYVDNDMSTPTVYVTIMNTYLAKATEDYNAKKDEVTYTVYALGKTSNELVKTKTQDISLKASGEYFDVQEVKKDDLALVWVADNDIQVMFEPEIIDKTVLSSFSNGNWVNNGTKYDYANTAKYKDGDLNKYSNPNMKEVTYNIVLDMYGYLIGIERNSDPDEYVFLTGLEAGASNLAAKNLDANIIHTDGTMETVTVDMTKSYDATDLDSDGTLDRLGTRITTYAQSDSTKYNLSQMNTWCTYSVNKSGVYTLKEVAVATTGSVITTDNKLGQFAQDVGVAALKDNSPEGDKVIKEGRTSLTAYYGGTAATTGYVYGNDKTVYINAELKGIRVNHNNQDRMIVDDVDSVVTGVKNVNLVVNDLGASKGSYRNPEAEIYTLYKEGNIIAVVAIGEDLGTAVDWAIPIKAGVEEEDYMHESDTRDAKPGDWTWYRKAITKDGLVDLTYVGESLDVIGGPGEEGAGHMVQGRLYEIRRDGNGNVRKAAEYKVGTQNNYSETIPNYEDIISTSGNRTHILRVAFDAAPGATDRLRYADGTLHVYTDVPKGFHVSSDVKTIVGLGELVKANLGHPNDGDADKHTNVDILKEKTIETYTGLDALKNVLDNELSANFYGYMTVIFEGESASFIVLDDRYGEVIDEGDNTDKTGGNSGKYYSYTYQSGNTGNYKVDVVANRPEWLTDDVNLTASFEIWVDGAWDQDKSITIGNTKEKAKISYTGTALDANPTIEIKNFEWTNLAAQTYYVKWQDKSGRDLSVGNARTDDLTQRTPTKLSATGAGVAMNFTLSSNQYKTTTPDYEIVGAYVKGSGADGIKKTANAPGSKTFATSSAVAGLVDGSNYEDYVYVKIDLGNMTPADKIYSIDVATAGTAVSTGGQTSGSVAVKVTAGADVSLTDIAPDTKAMIKITPDGTIDVTKGVYGSVMNVVVTDSTGKKLLNKNVNVTVDSATNDIEVGEVTVNDDLKVTVEKVSDIVPVTLATGTTGANCGYAGNEITVHLDRAVAMPDSAKTLTPGSNTGTFTIARYNVSGSDLKVYLDTAGKTIADGDTISVVAGAVVDAAFTSATTDNNSVAITLTAHVDGTSGAITWTAAET